MNQSPEHNLIFNTVKAYLDNHLYNVSNLVKNAIANEIAIRLRGLVRVKERDE